MSASLPIIDLGPLWDGSNTDLAEVAAAFDAAYREVGFAYIENHGVAGAVVDAAFAASRAFHELPAAAKAAIAINEHHRGYISNASSTIVTSSVAEVRQPNLSESFMMMHELAPDDADVLAGKPLAGPNQWPAGLPGFREDVTAYNDALAALALEICRALAAALGLAWDDLAPWLAKPTTFLRLLAYPPHPEGAPADQWGAAPHTDYGLITILAQDRLGGLEVLTDQDGWIDAPPLDGTFVMNFGDMVQRWANDRLRSTRHRVINNSGAKRYSIPFFFDPHVDTVVDVLPSCVGPDHPPRYQPVVYGDYLMHRLDANYRYRQTGT